MKNNNKLATILLASSLLLPGIAPIASGVASVSAAPATSVAAEYNEEFVVPVVDQAVRHIARENASPVGFVKRGEDVKFVAVHDKKWFKVEVDGKEGFVLRGDVTSRKNFESEDTTIHDLTVNKQSGMEEYYYVAVRTALRTSNAERYRPLKVLGREERVKYLGTTVSNDNWFKVQLDDGKTVGYIDRRDVTTKASLDANGGAVNVETRLEDSLEGRDLEAVMLTALRTQPGRQYRVVNELPRNTVVKYLGTTVKNSQWLKVEYKDSDGNTVFGYVDRGHVTKKAILNTAELDKAKAEAAKLEEKDYTEASWKALKAALDRPETTQEEVDTKTTAIKNAIAGLVKEVKELEVVSVSAINAKEVKVVFNKPVSKQSITTGDFAVTNTGTVTANTVADVKVSDDLKSAILLLTSNIPAAGVDVKIAEGAILSSDYREFPEFKQTAVKTSVDTTAPKLLAAKAIDATTIELTFDEPVDWSTNTGGIRVNGGSQVNGANNTKAGDYTYEFTVSALKDGSNVVQILKYADFAGNVEALTTTTVNYQADVSAPKVTSIKPQESDSFVVTLNKPVDTIANSNFTVKKGNYTFNSTDLTVKYVDAEGNLTADLTGTGTADGTTPSKYVKVTVPTQANTVNPLYGKDENSVNLNVSLSGYKNGTVIGDEFNGSVTLSKDLAAPKAVSERLITSDKSAKTITVPFDKNITIADANKLTVLKGAVKIAATPTASGKNLIITVTDAAGVTDGDYKLVLDKGLVKDASNNLNESTILNTEVTSTVSYAQKSNIFSDATFTDGKNVITVTYGEKVSDTAAETASYLLNDAVLPAGSVVYFTSTAKDTVKIELPASYKVSVDQLAAKLTLKVDAVKTAPGAKVVSSSATEAKAINEVVKLEDNVAPTLQKAEYVKDSNGLATGVKLTFSEAVDTTVSGSTPDLTDDFIITKGSTTIAYTVAAVSTGDTATDNIVILNFTGASTAPSGVTVKTNPDRSKVDLKDLSTNNKIEAFNVNVQ